MTSWSLGCMYCKETRSNLWWKSVKTVTFQSVQKTWYLGVPTGLIRTHTACDPLWVPVSQCEEEQCEQRGQEKQNPLFLTVTVLAWLLINWHCACHTRHLVGRRPPLASMQIIIRGSAGGIQFSGQVCYIAPCPAPAINLLWMHFGNCWAPSLIRGSVWQEVWLWLLPAPTICMPHTTCAEGSRAAYVNTWHINHA